MFNLLATKPFRPLILAIVAKFDKKETALVFQFPVSISARLIVSGGTTSGSVDDAAATASVDIFTEKVKTTVALKTELIDITPTDERFKEAVAVAKVSQERFARYYFVRLKWL